MEITKEEEAQIHALSDDELAAVFAIVEAAESAECTRQDCVAEILGVQLETIEIIGPYTIVQQLRSRIRQRLSN